MFKMLSLLKKKEKQVLSRKYDNHFADTMLALHEKRGMNSVIACEKERTATNITTLVIAASHIDYISYLDSNNFIRRDECMSVLYARLLNGVNLDMCKIYVTSKAREAETDAYKLIAAELDRRNSEDSFRSITIS